MLLKDAVNVLASGGGFSNPLDEVSASLSPKASALSASTTPSIKAAGDAIAALVASSNLAVTNLLGQMKTLLPIQKAANGIYNELNTTTGEQAFFQNTFAPLTAQTAHLQTLNTLVTSGHLAELAAVVFPAALTSPQTAALNAIVSATSTAASALAPIPAASAAGIAYGNSLLSGYSYAKFMTQPQPSFVQGVIGASTNITITG